MTKEDDLARLRSSDARWPASGDIYQLRTEKELAFLTHHGAPYTGGGVFQAPAGTRIVAWVIPEAIAAGAIAVSAGFLNHDEMEAVVIPESTRTMSNYGGYTLSVSIRELNEDFEFVGNVKDAAV
jgi:hypothetical protein